MKVNILRVKGNKWCELQVALTEQEEGFKRLSICGAEGRIETRARAKVEALEYWESFFENAPEERRAMAEREDKPFRTARSAARFVLQCDGEFHGLDVHKEEGNNVFLVLSCGQIREELAEYFPEWVSFFKWHLNDMHAECVHQEERGETYQTHPNAVCPDCGYKLGSQWARRELPPKVIAWVEYLASSQAA